MFLKQEKPEMDDFEEKDNLGSKGKILWKIKINYFLNGSAIKALPPPPSSLMAVRFFFK